MLEQVGKGGSECPWEWPSKLSGVRMNIVCDQQGNDSGDMRSETWVSRTLAGAEAKTS